MKKNPAPRRRRSEIPDIVDGVSVNGAPLLVRLDDGRIARADPSSFFVASFEIIGHVELRKRTFSSPAKWPFIHIRLPELDACG